MSSTLRRFLAQRDYESARVFADWIRTAQPKLPLLASNTIVTVSSKRLNDVRTPDKKYGLKLAEDASVAWLKQITIEHPCHGVEAFKLMVSSTGEDGTWQEVPTTVVKPTGAMVDCETTIASSDGALRPGAFYRVVLAKNVDTVVGTFRTHLALTPRPAPDPEPASPNGLDGWPVILKSIRGPASGNAGPEGDLLIVSLTSVATRATLGEAMWRWRVPPQSEQRAETPADDVCPRTQFKTTCTIDFLPPVDAMAELLDKVRAVRGKVPLVVLLSSMTDEDTTTVLESFPEVRIAILPQDSLLLGRASRATSSDAQRFSSDRGMYALVDANLPAATRLIVRPEWIAETGGIAELQAYSSETSGVSGWKLHPTGSGADVETIPGVPLKAVASNGKVIYHPLMKSGLKSKEYDPYLPCERNDPRPICVAFKSIWTDSDVFLGTMADALRVGSRSDLVIVPGDLVDDDAVAWLDGALSETGTAWLSRFILQRVVYRSYRFVKATVRGDALQKTLDAILKDPLNNGVGYCVRGLSPDVGCPSKLNPATAHKLRVDGRVIRPTFYYSVMLPDRLAEQQKLAHDDDAPDAFDALDAFDRHLGGEDAPWYPKAWRSVYEDVPVLLSRLDDRAVRRLRHYVDVSEASFGWSGVDADAPGGADVIPSNIENVAAARSSTTRSFTVKAEAALYDRKRFAFRALFDVDYAERRDPAAQLVSYDRDRLLLGARVDVWKVRAAGDLRPFIGFFWDGPAHSAASMLTAVRPTGTRGEAPEPTFSSIERPVFQTRFETERNLYRYLALGGDVLVNLTPPAIGRLQLQLTRAKFEWDIGESPRSPVDLEVDTDGAGSRLRLADIRAACPDKTSNIRTGDAQALLNAFFSCYPDALSPATAVRTATRESQQQRVVLEAEGGASIKALDRELKVTLFNQYRFYDVREATDLSTRRTFKFKAELAVPLWWRLEIGPSYSYERALIYASADNRFSLHRWEVRVKVPLFLSISSSSWGQ